MIRQEKKLNVPTDYEEDFRKTDSVFKYQSVFDPRSKKIVRLNEVTETDLVTDEELSFAGPYLSFLTARDELIASCDSITLMGPTRLGYHASRVKAVTPRNNSVGICIYFILIGCL